MPLIEAETFLLYGHIVVQCHVKLMDMIVKLLGDFYWPVLKLSSTTKKILAKSKPLRKQIRPLKIPECLLCLCALMSPVY